MCRSGLFVYVLVGALCICAVRGSLYMCWSGLFVFAYSGPESS